MADFLDLRNQADFLELRSDGKLQFFSGENTGSATAAANTAINAANSASAASNYFSTKALGEAGTVTGAFFAYPDGAGGLVYAERTAGSSIVIANAATTAALAAKVATADLAASGGAASVGFLQSGTGAVARTVQDKARDIVSVKDFGAVGDGVADDTAAIRLAVAVGVPVLFPGGTYRMTGTIVINGATSLVGDGTATIVADATGTYDGVQPVMFHYGRATTWTGSVSGLRCKVSGTFNQVYYHVIRAAADWSFERIYFDDIQTTNGGSLIVCEFSGLTLPAGAALSQVRGRITECDFIFAPAALKVEASSCQNETNGLIWSRNRIIGPGDDCIACHGGANIQIVHNYIETKLGRINLDFLHVPIRNVLIHGNTMIKKNASGNGGGIAVNLAGSTPIASQCENIVITDNILVNDDATYDMTYPIRLFGVTNFRIAGNIMENRRGAGTFIFRVERQTSSGAGSPHNVTDGIIENNRIVNGTIDYNQTGVVNANVVLRNNYGDAGGTTTYGFSAIMSEAAYEKEYGNIGINGTTAGKRLSGSGFSGGDLFHSFSRSALGVGTVLAIVDGLSASSDAWSEFGRQIERAELLFSAAITNGGNLNLYKWDGTTSTLLAAKVVNAGTKVLNLTTMNAGVPISTLKIGAGEALRVEFSSGAGFGGVDAVVRIFTTTRDI